MKIYRTSFNREIYKTVRKPTPKPSRIMDDGEGEGYSKRPEVNMSEDMPTLEDLKAEAMVLCESKGHHLGEWKDFSMGSKNYSSNICSLCYRDVIICNHPSSEKDIDGPATTEFCTDE